MSGIEFRTSSAITQQWDLHIIRQDLHVATPWHDCVAEAFIMHAFLRVTAGLPHLQEMLVEALAVKSAVHMQEGSRSVMIYKDVGE